MKNIRFASLIIALTLAVSASAAKAPWYLWKSKLNDGKDRKPICAQTMQGEWEKVGGPFKDSKCTVPGEPS